MNTGEDYQRYIDDWLGKLMNVLEADDEETPAVSSG